VISEINRQPVRSIQDYQQVVSHLQHAEPALFLVNRQGMTVYLTVKV
jgi:serine protease Do